MPRGLTEEQRANVQRVVLRLLETMSERELEAASKVPQPTLNAVKLRAKVGYDTARKLAVYVFRGRVKDENEAMAHLLAGTEPASEYALQETMYPKRGIVLDRLRGVIPKEVLDEVAAIVLPDGTRAWTEIDWLQTVIEAANRAQRLGKLPEN